jgi:DegV family protein with EDD domain
MKASEAIAQGTVSGLASGANMNRVQIVTDSTSDIPAALASEYNITVVACQVFVGDEVYQDGVDLLPEGFFKKLARSSELPRTSQPPVGRFADTYQRLLAEEPDTEILSIHVASTLSGTVNAAWAAAQMLPEPSRVEVIDSGQLSMGLGWAAIKAAQVARTGAARAEVSQGVKALLPRLRTVAMIDTLENLYKGGRISHISAVLGTALRIKPLLSVREGQVSVWRKVRTRSRAMKELVARVHSWTPLAEMAILHTGAVDLAQNLVATLHGLVPAERVVMGPAGPALTTHLGLGAVGVLALQAAEE